MLTVTTESPARRLIPLVVVAITLLLLRCEVCSGAGGGIDGRHSFSLTTFDPTGKLGQVERASIAASLGTPLVAVCRPSSDANGGSGGWRVVMAAPQILASPFVKDDGTARFSPVTSQIAVSHTGISADGRVIIAAAQRLAVEHAFTFDEEITIHVFLEELSKLFQAYTMKPGTRPFGVTLLIAYTPPSSTDAEKKPQLYRIDPSGSVVSIGNSYCVINGNFFNNSDLIKKLEEYADSSTSTEANSIEEDHSILSQILLDAIEHKSSKMQQETPESTIPTRMTIISASQNESEGLVIRRRRAPNSSISS